MVRRGLLGLTSSGGPGPTSFPPSSPHACRSSNWTGTKGQADTSAEEGRARPRPAPTAPARPAQPSSKIARVSLPQIGSHPWPQGGRGQRLRAAGGGEACVCQ